MLVIRQAAESCNATGISRKGWAPKVHNLAVPEDE